MPPVGGIAPMSIGGPGGIGGPCGGMPSGGIGGPSGCGGGTGIIGLNGAAARKGQVGDELIIMTFVQMTPEEAKVHQPNNLFPDRNNQVI